MLRGTLLVLFASTFAVLQTEALTFSTGSGGVSTTAQTGGGSGCVICSKNNKNKPSSLTFKYTAGQGASSHDQGSKAYGALTGTFPQTASISFSSGFSTTVSDGDTFTVSGSFSADSQVTISSQTIGFHTSCSVTLAVGNRFGPLTVLAGGQCPLAVPDPCGDFGCCPVDAKAPGQQIIPCANALCSNCYQDPCGFYGCCPETQLVKLNYFGSNCPRPECVASYSECPRCPAPLPAPPPAPPAQTGCTICDRNNKNRPSSLTFLYTAGQGVSNHQQDSKAYGPFTATYPASAAISMSGFSATVSDGETFTITGSFGAESEITIAGQVIGFHTSCSVTLATGNQFGPITVVGGGACGLAVPVAPSCFPYGCCAGSSVSCTDANCLNCCDASMFPETCDLCCPDGTPKPCCTYQPIFVKESEVETHVYTDKCSTTGIPDTPTATSLANFIEDFGGASCKSVNDPDTIVTWAVKLAGTGADAFEYKSYADQGQLDVLSDAHEEICDDLENYECPSIPINFRCCDPCDENDPTAKCTETIGVWTMKDCPTCTKMPRVVDFATSLKLEHFQCGAVSGKLPASTFSDLKAWYDDFGGKTCKSRNNEDAELIMSASLTFDELETLLCQQASAPDSCPSVPIAFECCDPCEPDALCMEQTASVYVPDCCPHEPEMIRPPGSKIVSKVGSCTQDQQMQMNLPLATATELNDWIATNGGGFCESQNNKLLSEGDMIWTATPGQNSAEFGICSSDNGCPSIDVEFRCCDPCDPVNKCVTATATFAIYDSNPPTITNIADGVTDECDGDPNSQLATWLSTAQCADAEGSATLTNSYSGVPTFATASYCDMYSTVTLKCEDECGLVSTAVYFHGVEDTIPPTLVVGAQDMTVECDGLGNAQELDAWVRSAGGMRVNDVCQGACPISNEPVIDHYRAQISDAASVDRMSVNMNCCQAMTPECQACMNGQSVVEFCNENPHVPGCVAYGGTIIDIIGQYSTNTKLLLDRQAMLTSTLSASGPFTLFTPTDAAWMAIPYPADFQGSTSRSMFENLLNDYHQTENVLMDHTFIGRLDLADLQVGRTIKTVSNVILKVESVSPYTFSVDSENYWLTFQIISGADVSNGMIYTIDKVIVGSWGTWSGYDWAGLIDSDHEQHPGKGTDGCKNVHFETSEVTFAPCNLEEPNVCEQCAVVSFTAADICNTGDTTETATFKIIDTTGPLLIKSAKDVEYAYTGTAQDQTRYTNWLNRHGGAVAEDACVHADDLVWTHDGAATLPEECNGTGDPDTEVCGCDIPVTFCVDDCSGQEACTPATFSLVDTDSAPRINEDGTCPGMDLEFPCDPRCADFDLWELNARIAMNQWVDDQGCLCADDCTAITWSALNVPLETNLCGTCGAVTFVASDTSSNFAEKELKYCFPEIFVKEDYCTTTQFGCCPGTELAKADADGTNCPCSSTLYGCCPDAVTPRTNALGNNCFSPVPPPPPPAGCTICDRNNKNRPSSLTFLYTAGQGVSNHQQDSKAYGPFTATYPASAAISMSGFSATVSDGETFTITGSFGAESEITIAGQVIGFHTSCSVTLATGNQFGPITVVGGGSCSAAPDPVQCGEWGCCKGTNEPKLNGAGTNCCGQFGCCDDGSDCINEECSTCNCATQRYGCCPGSSTARGERYGTQCPLQCGFFGCCPNSEEAKTNAQGSNCLPDPVCTFPQVCDNAVIDPGPTPDPCTLGFGCCPGTAIFKDDAIGTNCDCDTSQFGCCPFPHNEQAKGDAQGTDCPCGVHGCCTGSDTPKTDAVGSNCPCESTEFGCCPGTEDKRDDEGGSNCACGTTPGAPDCPCVETPLAQCTICDSNNKQRPSSLTILYTSDGANVNSQGNRAYGELTGTFPAIATLTTSGFSATVNDQDTFVITGSFSANTEWSVSGQVLGFHTSCSVPLNTGDRYGPFTILGGGTCVAPTPCPTPAPPTAPAQAGNVGIVGGDRANTPTAAPPATPPAPIRIRCTDPCTQSVFYTNCELESSNCYDFSPLACTAFGDCLVEQCEAFPTTAAGDSATSTFCQYGADCPAETNTVPFLNIRDSATGVVRPEVSPENCFCCELPKKNIVCTACGKVILVQCFQNDPACVNYNADSCALANVECLVDQGPANDNSPSPSPVPPSAVSSTTANTCSARFDACSVSKTKISALMLEWTGNVNGNVHVQTNRKVMLKPKSAAGAKKFLVKSIGMNSFSTVPRNPKVGDQFTLTAADVGRQWLPVSVSFKVDKGRFKFMTNCRKDSLRMGDEFGPFKVVGFSTNKVKSTCLTFEELLRSMEDSPSSTKLDADNDDDFLSQGALSEEQALSAGLSSSTIAAAIGVAVCGVLVVIGGVMLYRSTGQAPNDGVTLASDTFNGGGFSDDEYIPRNQRQNLQDYATNPDGGSVREDGTDINTYDDLETDVRAAEPRTAV